MSKHITLKIKEAYQRDVGRCIARIDQNTLDKIDADAGDIIEIIGNNEKRTVAKCLPLYPSDEHQSMIRLDAMGRHNTGMALADSVKIAKISSTVAKKVIIAPVEKIPPIDENYLSDALEGFPVVKGDLISVPYFGGRLNFRVTKTIPTAESTLISSKTLFKILDVSDSSGNVPQISYEDIGGLTNEIKKVREMIELPLRHPEIFEKLGIEAPKGILMHGPPGTGKTLLAKAVANESNAAFLVISGPEIMSKFYGESEARLREIFKEAKERAPTIIFIDEIDSITPKREEVYGEVERRVVSQMLAVMDGLHDRGKVIVIAATNRPNAIEPALRRPGRFDREIEIRVPDKDERKEILSVHTRNMPLVPLDETNGVDLDKLAGISHGYVGADLEYLCKEAAMKCLRRVLPEINLDDKIGTEVLDKLVVQEEDFRKAMLEVTPSAMREVYLENPDVHWVDIGGLEDIKRELMETVEWPMKYSKLYEKLGHKPPKGILLQGPSGTGKTLLAKAVATESEANFISVRGPELLSKWVGESERGIRKIFQRARQSAPCIIFFDEIDSIAQSRGTQDTTVSERVVSQLLTELDGMENLHGVLVIAATNRVDIIDKALMRPGRLGKVIEVPNPDIDVRERILEIHSRKVKLANDVDFKEIARLSESMSGAETASIISAAVSLRLHDVIKDYTEEEIKDLDTGLDITMDYLTKAVSYVLEQRERRQLEVNGATYYN